MQHPIEEIAVPSDLKSFELMKWTEWLIKELPENIKNELQVALTPVKYHQSALDEGISKELEIGSILKDEATGS